MQLSIYQVNAFTSEPFKGNPAGVCITESPLPASLMLSIAKEMAISETAFLSLSDNRLRWFTPKVEVALCGHGTLATVKVMDEKGLLDADGKVTFHTLSGDLHAQKTGERISLDFPLYRAEEASKNTQHKCEALGLKQDDVVFWGEFEGGKDFVVLKHEEHLRQVTPNYHQLVACEGRAMVLTAQSNRTDIDFIARYFAPWVGVDEDPVTGSAYCALAPYWAKQLNKCSLVGYQASERGGYVAMMLKEDRIELTGQAVTLIRGEISV
ncbi:phenazine biosynthesis protein PhzF [Vibrio sp. 10N.286.49.C2]|uniref:PhzF family phenazine biosynthesis protein n=1 Tax=unclassified Vibrio TaxID=2614977 RepID=UPI000C8595CE|nr:MULTISPECIES: PhzF family phenazine biosynthesis protein [unclassified Vibrio]PMH26474.1 phenazine biosynthesis protein PhzF [Vibrio sp. 10N.286.49.C2]PMH54802.1 phenazine biosynthesis protein PhzF [Vibrio sp. 10N.286.49.B1]PMH83978.1 phenazine biosynthesis protein PhzF [Vibrio sp. 10N.286.48.B7]